MKFTRTKFFLSMPFRVRLIVWRYAVSRDLGDSRLKSILFCIKSILIGSR